jgi:hypothetical protein
VGQDSKLGINTDEVKKFTDSSISDGIKDKLGVVAQFVDNGNGWLEKLISSITNWVNSAIDKISTLFQSGKNKTDDPSTGQDQANNQSNNKQVDNSQAQDNEPNHGLSVNQKPKTTLSK